MRTDPGGSARQRPPHLHDAHQRLGDPGPISGVLLGGDLPRIEFRFQSLLDPVQGVQSPLHFPLRLLVSQAGCRIAPARSSRTNTRARANAARYPSRYASVPVSRSDNSLIFSYRTSSVPISMSMACSCFHPRLRLGRNSPDSTILRRFSCRRSFRVFTGFFGLFRLSAIAPLLFDGRITQQVHTIRHFGKNASNAENRRATGEHVTKTRRREEVPVTTGSPIGTGHIPLCSASCQHRPRPTPRT